MCVCVCLLVACLIFRHCKEVRQTVVIREQERIWQNHKRDQHGNYPCTPVYNVKLLKPETICEAGFIK